VGVQLLLNDFEFEFLATLSDPIRAVQTMLLTKLLSTHAQDEVYLSTEHPEWILVSPLPFSVVRLNTFCSRSSVNHSWCIRTTICL
jgi:hypothetical protein